MPYIDRCTQNHIVGIYECQQYEGQEFVESAELYIPPASPEELRKAAIDQAIEADTVITNLKAMTSAEFDAWWSANVTNAAQAISVLKRLARVVIRRSL
jgi:hypothetical protein